MILEVMNSVLLFATFVQSDILIEGGFLIQRMHRAQVGYLEVNVFPSVILKPTTVL